MNKIAQERAPLSDSLWSATANASPEWPALSLETEADCIVIGAGFTGLSAALHLAEAGQHVVVLEAQTPGWGASGRNGGQVNPGLKGDPDDIEARFGADLGRRMVAMSGSAGDLVFDLIKRHRIECNATRCGWIRAATNDKGLNGLRSTGQQWRARGDKVEDLNAEEMERLLGTREYMGGLLDRRGGNLHPLNYALGLAAACKGAGVEIYGNSRVTSVQSAPDAVSAATENGIVRAARMLICTNAYTGDLAAPFGKSLVPVTSVQVATEPLGDNLARSILPQGHSPSDTRRLLLYFRKDPGGRFVMGGRGALGDAAILKRQDDLRRKSEALYPDLKQVSWRYAWGGDVAVTRDHTPGLNKIAPNVMAGVGYNGRGVAMATAMGRLLAEWAAGCPDAELDFPVTQAKPIPFHRFRRIGLGATAAVFRLLDRLDG